MARPTKLNAEVQRDILTALSSGTTIEKMCDFVGIHKSTFYEWLNKGLRAKSGKFSDFSDAVIRAKAQAHIAAAGTLRKGMQESETVSETVETLTETRVNPKTGELYDYKRTVRRTTTTHHPADWRAAVEFLKRRDAANWSATQNINHNDWRTRLLSDIQQGAVKIDDVIDAFGSREDFVNAINEPSLAAQLFAAAGVQLQDREG